MIQQKQQLQEREKEMENRKLEEMVSIIVSNFQSEGQYKNDSIILPHSFSTCMENEEKTKPY